MSFKYNLSLNEPHIVALAAEWAKARRVALVTLINIEGNAPYPIGTQMLVDENGRYVGQITGGCAEQAIADHAVGAINAQTNQQVRYGLGSDYFDIQLPCGSGIDVSIETSLGTTDYANMAAQLAARQIAEWRITTKIGCFVKRFAPTARLIVAGQGPIVCALAQSARQSGFEVLILAQNSATLDLCKDADLVAQLLDTAAVDAIPCDPFTGFVSLFHEHDYETALFASLLPKELFYFGALGSKRTHARRSSQLSQLGVSDALIKKIHGPVGIDIGANTPAQISISILAELIQQMNKSLSVLAVSEMASLNTNVVIASA